MPEQTTVLQLVLNQLQLGNSISTIDDRIALQKVVCLIQEAGLPLGYSFNWYVRGPYSPGLASDYYQLAAQKHVVESEAQKLVLRESAAAAVSRVAQLLSVPPHVPLNRVGWLELLASIAFLIKKYRLSIDAARVKIQSSKAPLAPFFDQAVAQLRAAGLL
jgi:hypothetical protein